MSLFQKRHFDRIAEIAAQLDLTDVQLETLTECLVGTNPKFNTLRFVKYVEAWKLELKHQKEGWPKHV